MTQSAATYSLAPLADVDADALHLLTVEAGWPHRLADWRFALGLGHGIAARDAAGRIVGCAMWWPFGDAVATVGLVLVSHRLQGRGLGRRLMDEVLDAASGRTIWLNATEAGRPLYERLGFRPVGTIQQRQGLARLPAEAPAVAGEIRPFGPADRDSVLSLDRAATGRDRHRLLEALLREGTAVVHAVEGQVAGYAVARRFGRGHVVGPILARDDSAAIALVHPSLTAHAGGFLRTDTPADEGLYVRFLEQAGLAEVEPALTMVRGEEGVPSHDGSRIYGLASQALG